MLDYAPLILPVIFILIGAGIVWTGRQRQLRQRAAQSWPTAPGKILSSQAYEERKREKDGSTTTQYRRSVEYEFVVGETTHRGKRIDLAGESTYSIKSSCERDLAAYPAGATVPVHYDPVRPDDCVLDVSRAGSVGLYVLGGLLMLAGIAFLGVLFSSGFAGGPRMPVP